MLVDTHAHIHDKSFDVDGLEAIKQAQNSQVEKIVCVGTDVDDSKAAVEFVEGKPECVASVGLHPHDAKDQFERIEELHDLINHEKVVAIGECGLDYYYENSPKDDQIKAFRRQIEIADQYDLPMIWHIRDAFDDFWPIIDDFPKIRGVVHSFTSTVDNMQMAVERGFYVAFNGIMTFTKQESQLEALRQTPLENLLLETDTPFLTPKPYRGKPNTPANVKLVAEFVAKQKGISLEELAQATTENAVALFGNI